MALPPGPLEAKPKVQVVPKQPEAVPKLAVPEQTTAAAPKHPPVEVAEAPKPKVVPPRPEKDPLLCVGQIDKLYWVEGLSLCSLCSGFRVRGLGQGLRLGCRLV